VFSYLNEVMSSRALVPSALLIVEYAGPSTTFVAVSFTLTAIVDAAGAAASCTFVILTAAALAPVPFIIASLGLIIVSILPVESNVLGIAAEESETERVRGSAAKI
jgi:hypothetical protein